MSNSDSKNPKNGEIQADNINKPTVDLDTLFKDEIGQIGLYQFRTLLVLGITVIFTAWTYNEYIFAAARIRTRCLIPECDTGEVPVFIPDWLENAVPTTDDGFDNCQRFPGVSGNLSQEHGSTCPAVLFDQQNVISCDEIVYETTNSAAYTFELACDEWRRSLIGSLRIAGMLMALPLTGFISDRWGRRVALVLTAVNAAWLGSLRYFANTYVGFVVSQVIESMLSSGGYTTSYILIMEIVGPKYRVAASAVLTTCYSIGQILLALIAWYLPYWRHLTLAVFIPQFLTISTYWLLPESIRWYLSKQKYKEAEATLRTMARVNKKQLSDNSIRLLKESAENVRRKKELEKEQNVKEPWLIVLVFQHKPILLRCAVSPVWWIATTLTYYGLTINSVNISGNLYVNFMAVTAVEIPGFWIGVLAMNTIGRKYTLILAFWSCAACQFTYLFMSTPSIAVYLVGKCSIAVVAATIYVYTSELYPTKYRHRLFAFSSMMGRIGSIVAPLTPAFGDTLPFILFGGFAAAAGLLLFLTPETLNARFPDTMEEAAAAGKKKKSQNS